MSGTRRPNIVFVFADQMRAQDVANFTGDSQVRTPNLDRLATQGTTFTHAVSSCPVCTPYRASLLTGRYPLTNGMVLNDVRLPVTERSVAHCLNDAGYRTGYVGKWHLDGSRRGGFTPPGPRRQGFDDYWAVANCTHNYMKSFYFEDDPEPIHIDGYDADHFTDLSIDFVNDDSEDPFCLFLSWGPPHDPYRLMPEDYIIYDPDEIQLRDNATKANREHLAGYYSHITALDRCFGRIMDALDQKGVAEDTILVFTSDHGDMLGSQGLIHKQKPWDESIMVPFVIRYPGTVPAGQSTDALINTPDLMPTLLSLSGLPTPTTVDGIDFAPATRGEEWDEPGSAFICNPCPFGEPFPEWRGVRTKTHTYVETVDEPWLLYDNVADPFQQTDLQGHADHADVQGELKADLQDWLKRLDDDFAPSDVICERLEYKVDKGSHMPYDNIVGNFEP